MNGIDPTVLVAIISTGGGVAIAYIVNIASKKVQRGKAKKGPMERIDELFDGYDRLIKQKDIEDERKAKLIEHLETEIAEARKTVRRLERDLEISKEELDTSRSENVELRRALERLRAEFNKLTIEDTFKNRNI